MSVAQPTPSQPTPSQPTPTLTAPPAAPASAQDGPTTAKTPPNQAEQAKAATNKPLDQLYDEALNAFKYQDFELAIPLLKRLLAKGSQLDRKRRWRVREYLGAALWFNGDKQGAADQFTGLLIKNPQARLDPAYYPPQMISTFVRVRRKMLALGMIKAEDKPAPSTSDTTVADINPVLLWLPFGVGQLANDQTGKGLAFMITEAALASTSVYYRFYVNGRDAGAPKYALDPTNSAIQVISGATFFLLAGWGIADAVLTHRGASLPQAGTLPTSR